jgi:hypothetical protein
MKQIWSVSLLVLTAIVLAGCSDSTGPADSIYTLVAIDGHPLPVSSNYVDGSTTVVSGSLDLDGDGYAVQVLRISESGMVTRPEHSEVTYHRTLTEPPELRLIPITCGNPCAVEAIGQISGSTITLSLTQPYNGTVYTYQLKASM